jgi:hypothetical protein
MTILHVCLQYSKIFFIGYTLYIQYTFTYIVQKYIINLYKLKNQVENQAFGKLFWLFRSEWKLIWYILTMYVCIACNVKISYQLPHCLKWAETSVLIVFIRVLDHVYKYTLAIYEHRSANFHTQIHTIAGWIVIH